MVDSEKKENGLLTGLPFQGRQACYTTQQRRRLVREARNGDKASRGLRRRRWMDVLEALNGMLIKGLGCGLRCKDHHQHQNVPLEMSVISAQTRQLCWPADAPCSTSTTWWLVWTLQCISDKKQFSFHKPAARLRNITTTLCQSLMETDRVKQRREYKDEG